MFPFHSFVINLQSAKIATKINVDTIGAKTVETNGNEKTQFAVVWADGKKIKTCYHVQTKNST